MGSIKIKGATSGSMVLTVPDTGSDNVPVNVDAINSITGKNLIINGGFDVWQRGTSFSSPAAGSYNADRFVNGSATSIYTISKSTATIGGRTVNTHRTAVSGSGNVWMDSCYQVIEDHNILDGQYITLSAWVKTNIDNMTFRQWNTSNHGDTFPSDGNWNYVTATVLVNTSAGAIKGLNGSTFGVTTNSAAGLVSGNYIEIAQMQVELGSVATNFEYRSYGEELALCQRYFEMTGATHPGTWTGDHYYDCIYRYSIGATTVIPGALYKVTKRASPSVIIYNKFGVANTWHTNNVSTAVVGVNGGVDGFVRFFSASNASANQNNFFAFTADAEL